MPRFHPRLVEWLRTHHGVVAHARLLELGLSPGQIRSMLACGELILVHEGVYRHAVWPDSFLATCGAACAADPSLVVTCGGAARIWEFRRSKHAGLHLICPGTTLRVVGGPRIHRTTLLTAEHIHLRDDGIRVATPPRAVFDLARHLRDLDLESVIEQGIDRERFDLAQLQAIATELCTSGRAGSARFSRVLASRPAWRRAADSHPEVVLRTALADAGLVLTPQLAVDLGDGLIIHPDLGDASARFYVEIDGHAWHGTREAIERDRRRDRRLRLLGCRVERVGTDEVERALDRVVDEIVRAHRQHAGGEAA